MLIKKISMFLMIFLFTTGIAYGISFDALVTPVKDHIAINEKAVYNITIKNNLETAEEFRIRNFDYPVWDISTEPLSNPILVNVKPKSKETVQIFLNSLQNAQTPVGSYSINLRVDLDSKKENLELPLTVAIKSTEALISGYLPNVKASIFLPAELDPREKLVMRISLKNLNQINYDNLVVKVKSKFINEELTTTLEPAGEEGSITNPESEKTLIIEKEIDSSTPPQKDVVFVEVFYKDRKIESELDEFEIVEYSYKDIVKEEKTFLKSKKTFKVASNNFDYDGKIEFETTPVKRLFTSTSPGAELIKKDGRYFYVWDVNLGADKTQEISVTENYRPLAVIVSIILTVVFAYFVLRSPLVMRKEVVSVAHMEGGISHMKVVIKVKNRSGRKIDNIEVSDNITSIGEFEKETDIGSLKPAKLLRHPHKGGIIKWHIETLEGGEERVLSYKFNLKLPILGEYVLPFANASCNYGKRHVLTNSNRPSASGHH